jgi:hypothetical protein
VEPVEPVEPIELLASGGHKRRLKPPSGSQSTPQPDTANAAEEPTAMNKITNSSFVRISPRRSGI